MEAKRWRDPEGLSWTIVVPVPWRLAMSLKLLTRVSPLIRGKVRLVPAGPLTAPPDGTSRGGHAMRQAPVQVLPLLGSDDSV